MKLVGIMPVRNEAWCLGLTLRAGLKWCDQIVISDHRSTDGTPGILSAVTAENLARMAVNHDTRAEWHEMEQRQALLDAARGFGATHIAILDADEILTGNLLPTIRGMIEQLPPGWLLQLPGYNLRSSLTKYHTNGIWGNRVFSAVFHDHPKLHWAGDTFHQREPQGFGPKTVQPIEQGQGGIMHLWGVSVHRLRAKHALYKVSERIRWPEKPVQHIEAMYNLWKESSERWTYAETPAEWWAPYQDLRQYVSMDDSNPWQIAEVKRLIKLNGQDAFKGLDLFGIA